MQLWPLQGIFGFSFAVAGALWLAGNAADLLTLGGTWDEKMKGLQFFSLFGAGLLAGLSLAFLNLSLQTLKPIVAARRIFVRDIESPNSEIDQNPPPLLEAVPSAI